MTAAEMRAQTILKRLAGIENPVICEVGVFIADMSRYLLEVRRDLTMYLVDSWSGQAKDEYKATNDFHARLNQDQQDKYYRQACTRLHMYGERAKILRMDSAEAINHIGHLSLDLVFIDADHSYEGCKQDIHHYFGKVKVGGYIGGHDYDNNEQDFKFGVKKAVDEFAEYTNKQIELDKNYTWYIAV